MPFATQAYRHRGGEASQKDVSDPLRSLPSRHPSRATGQLQRALGNQAVGRLLAAVREAVSGEPESDQRMIEELQQTGSLRVQAVFRSGARTPEQRTGPVMPHPDTMVAQQAVAPTSSPNVHAGGGNTCRPSRPTLSWDVVEDGANWRANVTVMTASGEIHITDWPSHPSTETVPNTVNPVDGGNINDTAGSDNRWSAAIADMSDYDSAGGGAGPNWHSTAASSAHEWAHWNEDWLGDCIPTADWNKTNQAIDAMKVPKASHADAAAARTALEPTVTTRFNSFVRAAIRRWNNVIAPQDRPGGGGRGYAAGKRVLDGLISSVRTYAVIKGWTAPPSIRGGGSGGGGTP